MVTFNREQMAFLKTYEDRMQTAVYSRYVRAIPREDLKRINGILEKASGIERTLHFGCGVCTLELLTDVGRIYFAQKERNEKRKKTKTKKEK